jgi:Outer membrane protein and related peptidoglycan-associated (lipo)proteins
MKRIFLPITLLCSLVFTQTVVAQSNEQPSIKSYANYDFVPGDKIIFHYDMAGEKDAEIPGRMAVNDGSVEVQTYNGEKVLFIPKGASLSMKPLMKDEGYLPEQFTLEFDVLSNGNDVEGSTIDLYFRSKEDANVSWSGACLYYIRFHSISGPAASVEFSINKPDGSSVGGGSKSFPEPAIVDATDKWRHVAIYVNKNIGKVYVDQHRVVISNQVSSGARMVTFEFLNDTHPILIKNIRIAAGGSDAYQKVVTDGKYVAYGILFDVNKSTLKPESMGTINEIAKMMKEHPELKFEIGGHTDSDGSAEHNKKLSLERAEAVKQQLVSMGIAADRLTTQGYGSTKPVADNSSPENKAKNRRVEFVKQ